MECPNCKLINLPGTVVCDCGHNLELGQAAEARRSKGRISDALTFQRWFRLSCLLSVVNTGAAFLRAGYRPYYSGDSPLTYIQSFHRYPSPVPLLVIAALWILVFGMLSTIPLWGPAY